MTYKLMLRNFTATRGSGMLGCGFHWELGYTDLNGGLQSVSCAGNDRDSKHHKNRGVGLFHDHVLIGTGPSIETGLINNLLSG